MIATGVRMRPPERFPVSGNGETLVSNDFVGSETKVSPLRRGFSQVHHAVSQTQPLTSPRDEGDPSSPAVPTLITRHDRALAQGWVEYGRALSDGEKMDKWNSSRLWKQRNLYGFRPIW